MTLGRVEPRDATDQQCGNCGTYFAANAIHNHQPACPLRDYDAMIQPLDGVDEGSESPGVTESGDGVLASSEVEAPEADSAPDTAVRGDGGPGLGLSGPPAEPADATDDVDDDLDDDPETVACPNCGADSGCTPDELEDGKVYTCTDCGDKRVWRDD